MKLPRVRFSVRRMMIAVALVAVVLGLMVRRANFLREKSRWDSFISMRIYSVGSSGARYFDKVNVDKAIILRDKYERAARYPWLPVAPDPKEVLDPLGF